jgi:hypothetical protein
MTDLYGCRAASDYGLSRQQHRGAEYMLAANATGDPHLYGYAGSGVDWAWTEIPGNGQSTHPDPGMNSYNV